MAVIDCHQAMIFLAILLFATVHAQAGGHLLAGAKHREGISSRRSPSNSTRRMRSDEEEELFVPVQSVVYRWWLASREPFATCGGCRCCSNSSSNRSSCIQTQCCFGIICNLPGKPFGLCSFSPKTCGCGPSNCA